MTTGLRQAKRAALAHQLATTTFDLVRRDGFAQVTVEDVVAAANVSRRTFSNYYPCKEAAVAAVVGQRVHAALDAWAPPVEGDVLSLIGHLVEHQVDRGTLEVLGQVAELASVHPQLVPYVREAQWQVWSAVGERVLAAIADPSPQDVETVHLAVGALFGLVNARWAATRHASDESLAPLHSQVRAALARLRAGLGAS